MITVTSVEAQSRWWPSSSPRPDLSSPV